MTDYTWHIPDPETQPEFYADVAMKRAFAWGIDSLIVGVATLLILPFTAFIGLLFFPFLFLTTGFFYRVLTITQGSATWGMRIMAIEFRTSTGERFDGNMALAHSGIFTAMCFFIPAQLLSMALIAASPRGQGIPDQVLSTVVLNKRAGV